MNDVRKKVRPAYLYGLAAAASLLLVPALRAYAGRSVSAVTAVLRKTIADEEGRVAWVYDDATGKPWAISKKGKATFGIGHLVVMPADTDLFQYTPSNPAPGDVIDALFDVDVKKHSAPVDQLGIALNENQRAALISLVYNIGPGGNPKYPGFKESGVRRHLLAGRYLDAANAFRNWHRANGKDGVLAARRERERKLFLTA